MKNFVLNKCINIIKKNKTYDEEKLEIIKYGLESFYLSITKIIIIGIIAATISIFKEFIIFLIIMGIIRIPSFGIHASKTWICLVVSTIAFIGIPLISLHITLNLPTKIIVGIISVIGILIFSPADTVKRPIINKKRRKIYKISSTIIAIIYITLSIIIKNNFISNCFFFATILANIFISPITYKLSHMPYNNYKTYIAKYGLN